jgi:hypothetical protein
MTDVLTAIDDALETGVAADDDALTRELQELALALRDDSPKPTPVYREWLDKQVEAGFPKQRKQKRPWWKPLLEPAAGVALVAVFVLMIAGVATLGGRSGGDDSGSGGGSESAAVAPESGDSAGGVAPDSGDSAGGGGAEPAIVQPSPGAAKARQLDRAAGGAADQSSPAVSVPPGDGGFVPGRRDRKIERSIALELEMPVDQMARVAEQVTAVTNRHGGFVLSSSVSTGKESAGGDFELRIPSSRLRPAVRDLSGLADVRTQSQTGRDVTREHVTTRDRLQAARAERRSLLRRLEVATTDEEAEALRRQLDIVAGELNGLRGQLRDLRLRTDYAVVTVSLFPNDGESGAGAGGSFDDALRDAGDLLVGVAGVLVRALAVALPLGVIALLGWGAARAVQRRRRESALA